jgi:hypothetical protein
VRAAHGNSLGSDAIRNAQGCRTGIYSAARRDARPNGYTDATLLANGFEIELLIGLGRDGFTTTAFERVKAGKLTVDVARVRITDAGRRALAE